MGGKGWLRRFVSGFPMIRDLAVPEVCPICPASRPTMSVLRLGQDLSLSWLLAASEWTPKNAAVEGEVASATFFGKNAARPPASFMVGKDGVKVHLPGSATDYTVGQDLSPS